MKKMVCPISDKIENLPEDYQKGIENQKRFCELYNIEHELLSFIPESEDKKEIATEKDKLIFGLMKLPEYAETCFIDADCYFLEKMDFIKGLPFFATYKDGEPDLSIVYVNNCTEFFKALVLKEDAKYPWFKRQVRKTLNNKIGKIPQKYYFHDRYIIKKDLSEKKDLIERKKLYARKKDLIA